MTTCCKCGWPLTMIAAPSAGSGQASKTPRSSEDPRPSGPAHPGSTPRAGQARSALSAGLSTPDPNRSHPAPSRSQHIRLPFTHRKSPTVSHLFDLSCVEQCGKPFFAPGLLHIHNTHWRDGQLAASSVLFRLSQNSLYSSYSQRAVEATGPWW